MHGYQIERARQIAESAKAGGFRAFLAARGNYGFYTDCGGSRVVSFQVNGLEEVVSGNYVTSEPHKTGSGWRIADTIEIDKLTEYFAARAPFWAVGNATVRPTTLSEHLERYGASSQYTEI